MMGPKQEAQAALFYEFSLDDHVPQDHLLRSIDRFVDLSDIRHLFRLNTRFAQLRGKFRTQAWPQMRYVFRYQCCGRIRRGA